MLDRSCLEAWGSDGMSAAAAASDWIWEVKEAMPSVLTVTCEHRLFVLTCPPAALSSAATDAMYQFSLDAYNSLFHLSLNDSPKTEALADRIKALNDYHTYAVYKYAARGLFEQHKLLLSLQMCAKILQASGQINAEEWQFFLQVGKDLCSALGPDCWVHSTGMFCNCNAERCM